MIQSGFNGEYVDADAMFGCGNVAAVPPLPEVGYAAVSMTGDTMFQLLCLALLLATVLLLRHRSELQTVAAGLWSGFAEEAESNRKTTLPNGFLRAALLAGIFAATTLVVRTLLPRLPEELLPETVWAAPVSAAAVAVAFAAVWIYQWTVLQAVALVTGSRDFIALLIYVKKACFAASALFAAPVILLSALANDIGHIWFYIIAAECCILAFLFLKETFMLFIRKKVPIFQWFLYLCTVEAFPLTLICASIARLR